jgi:hypothetical protein
LKSKFISGIWYENALRTYFLNSTQQFISVVKHKAQRIKHKDGIPAGDNFRSDFLMPSLFFVLYLVDLFQTAARF